MISKREEIIDPDSTTNRPLLSIAKRSTILMRSSDGAIWAPIMIGTIELTLKTPSPKFLKNYSRYLVELQRSLIWEISKGNRS